MTKLKPAELMKALEKFDRLERRHRPSVDLEAFQRMLRKMDPSFSDDDVLELIECSGAGSVRYHEFFQWLCGLEDDFRKPGVGADHEHPILEDSDEWHAEGSPINGVILTESREHRVVLNSAHLKPPEVPGLLDNCLLCLPQGAVEHLHLRPNMEDKGS